ncbi:MAG TPA: hypothetical protein VMW35_14550 [Myxococcota bacterium]|nr:hypothetical protein [Myxococcota bacterium]
MVRALFVSYGVVVDRPDAPAMIGVLKRCLRFIDHLAAAGIEPHLLHFGALPKRDPLVRRVLPTLALHRLPEGPPRPAFERLYRGIRPDVVVLGEGPARGMMWAASRAAHELGIRQVCIENYYAPSHPPRLERGAGWVDRWILLGLPLLGGRGDDFGPISARVLLVPPLLDAADDSIREPVDLTILGYDDAAERRGLALFSRMPPGSRARLLSRRFEPDRAGDRIRTVRCGPGQLDLIGLPTDARLRSYLATSKIVVAKSGYQQMLESLAVGTPVLASAAPGGIPKGWLAPELERFVRYLPEADHDWTDALCATATWLGERPEMPWTEQILRLERPALHAARALAQLLRDARAPAAPRLARSGASQAR